MGATLNVDTNIIEAKKHKIIRDRGLLLAEVLHGEEKKYVLSIVNTSRKFIKKAGEKRNIVLYPEKSKKGQFIRAVKRYIRTDFISYARLRLKDVSLSYADLDGLCNRCSRYAEEIDETAYSMEACKKCEELMDYRVKVWQVQNKRFGIIEEDFSNAIENTDFPDQLIGNWMLLMNKMNEDKESKHIDKALKEFIRDELINEFRNQNKQLLKKYDLWQNQ